MKLSKQQILRFLPMAVLGLVLFLLPTWSGISVVSLATKIIIYALLVMSLDIVFGYTGLWSFCHAAIFGVAAYTNAILITRFGITSFWLAAPLSLLVAALFSAFFAWISLRMRGVYFLLITLALGQIVYTICQKWQSVTGGTDGIINVPYPDIGISIRFATVNYFYFCLVIFIICAFILYRIIKSPFGYSLQGIRENETRMITLGYNAWMHKFTAFVISGLFAGVAGVLYVHFNGVIAPGSVNMSSSGLATIMLIIGGVGTLWGGLAGSAFIYTLSYYVSMITPDRWQLILGACFILVVMFAKGGIMVHANRLWDKLMKYTIKTETLGKE